MIAKLINNELVYPSEGERKKIVITNPSDESLKFNMGYKDLVIDEQPPYDPETEYLEAYYEEEETTIYQHWEVKPIPEPEPELEETPSNEEDEIVEEVENNEQ